MIIVLGNIIIIIIITTILIITTVTIINEAMRIHSQPSLQFEDLEQRLKKDEEPKNGVRNLVLFYSNLDYETVFNTLNTKMVGRKDIVFCAGYCYY